MFPTNILGSLHLARRALIAHQTTLDTIGHNLANAATPGYTRQRTELVAVRDRGGVDVQQIRRIQDRFQDLALVTERQALGRARTQEGMLQRLQGVFTDAGASGLGAQLDELFAGFEDVSVTPADPALRASLADRGSRLATTFQEVGRRVEQLQRDLTTEIRQHVDRANTVMDGIADLHRQIIAARGTPTPNDLLDRRDTLVTELAELVGVAALDRPNGTVQIAMAGTGVLLVDDTHVAPLAVGYDAATDTVTITAGDAALPVAPRTGALGAAVDGRNDPDGPVKRARSDLDALAAAIVREVNRVHASGSGLTGHESLTSTNAVSSAASPLDDAGLALTPGPGAFEVVVHDASGFVSQVTVPIAPSTTTLADVAALIDADPHLTASVSSGYLTIDAGAGYTFTFAADTSDTLAALGVNTFFTGSDAATIGVNPVVVADPGKIAAARVDATGEVHPGDGANALDMARLRTALLMDGGTTTLTEYYGGAVGRVGSAARDAIDTLDRQEAATTLVTRLQQSAAGVSTDEELIAMSQTQTMYAAAARFATTIDEILRTLLAMAA